MLPPNLKFNDFTISDNPNLSLCKCFACDDILNQPVIIKGCEHVFCFSCLATELKGRNFNVSKCPKCNIIIKPNDVTASNYINSMLQLLVLSCKTCTVKFLASTQYQEYQEHIKCCTINSSSNSSPNTSLSDVYSLTPENIIPRDVENAALHVIKTKIAQSDLPNCSIKFKSGGPWVSFDSIIVYIP